MPFEECGDYGLLGEVMSEEEYTATTGGLVYAEIEDPGTYDDDITDDMDDHERKRMEANHNERQEAWYTRKGALRGLCTNIRDALDEKYYIQLKKAVIGYKRVTIKQYINHLDVKWCKLDTKVIKQMKDHYYRGWQQEHEESIHEFIKRLDEDQEALLVDGIKISDDDKMQHYMEQMYDCGIFDIKDFRTWEEMDPAEQTWDTAVDYFEGIVESMETFKENMGGTAKKAKFESAAQVKEKPEQQHQEVADAVVQQFLDTSAANEEHIQTVTANQSAMVEMQANMQKMMAMMQEQMKESNTKIAALQKQLADSSGNNDANKENNGGGGGRGRNNSSKWKKCTHCGRLHPHSWFKNKKCYLHPDNANKSPEEGGPPAGFIKKE